MSCPWWSVDKLWWSSGTTQWGCTGSPLSSIPQVQLPVILHRLTPPPYPCPKEKGLPLWLLWGCQAGSEQPPVAEGSVWMAPAPPGRTWRSGAACGQEPGLWPAALAAVCTNGWSSPGCSAARFSVATQNPMPTCSHSIPVCTYSKLLQLSPLKNAQVLDSGLLLSLSASRGFW